MCSTMTMWWKTGTQSTVVMALHIRMCALVFCLRKLLEQCKEKQRASRLWFACSKDIFGRTPLHYGAFCATLQRFYSRSWMSLFVYSVRLYSSSFTTLSDDVFLKHPFGDSSYIDNASGLSVFLCPYAYAVTRTTYAYPAGCRNFITSKVSHCF